MSRGWFAVAVLLGTLTGAAHLAAAPVPKDAKLRADRENSNALLKEHRANLKIDASTEWQGWPVGNAFDGEPTTSWYSNSGDAPMNNTTPWLRATFPDDVLVRRVTVLGNRDPNYPNGYLILAGKFELLDKDGKVLAEKELKAAGEKHDFDWIVDRPPGKVRAVRFTATQDQKQSSCVAVSEFQVE
jgi:hypothetical protein